MEKRHLGTLIKRFREQRNVTQIALAHKLGLDASVSISRWEHGVTRVPWIHYRSISKVLQIPWSTLMSAASEDDPGSVSRLFEAEKRMQVTPSTKLSIAPDPVLLDKLDALLDRYPGATLKKLLDASIKSYVDRARHGLDANLEPIEMPASPQHGSLLTPAQASKK